MPLYGSGYIFSKSFFTGWVAVGIIWIFASFIAVGLYPAWESRVTLMRILKLIFTGRRPLRTMTHVQPIVADDNSEVVTPVKEEMNVKVI